jgi:very-short-patch-repair endonuclease
MKNDRARDRFFLTELSIKTLRFSNRQVLHRLDTVLSIIQQHIYAPPPREEGLGVEVRKRKERRKAQERTGF